MPYTAPTAKTFGERFALFQRLRTEDLEQTLDEAAGYTDGTWPERERALGHMLYAAHLLTLRGFTPGSEGDMFRAGVSGLKSISDGQISITRFDQAGGADDLAQTSYGRQFQSLVRRLFPPILVV